MSTVPSHTGLYSNNGIANYLLRVCWEEDFSCPGQCEWVRHINNLYRFELYTAVEVRTSDELKRNYQQA